MFLSIRHIDYDANEKQYLFELEDTCFSCVIPSIRGIRENIPSPKANSIALYTILKFYENKNRNVPHNVARYYLWLLRQKFKITASFIDKQFVAIDQLLGESVKRRYHYSTLRYLQEFLKQDIQSGVLFLCEG